MPLLTLATARNVLMTATRRFRRQRTRRAAIGGWWRDAKIRLGIESPRRRVTDAPAPQVAAAAAGIGAGGMLLMAFRRRVAHMKNKAMGAMHEARSTESAPDTDKALADKVRTEMFRRPDAPKGAVNVSAVDGIVYLRGEVASDEEIQRLVDDALSVAGVLRVESLLHTPGTPAPTGGAG